MENRAHALIAGCFVLLLGLATLFALWWFKQGGMQTHRYVVDTQRNVTGLNLQGQVRYRGIRAGKVEAIDTDPADPRRIFITIGLDTRFTVTRGTSAVLGQQGVTGIAYVQIEDDGSDLAAAIPGADGLIHIPMRDGAGEGLAERAGRAMEQVQLIAQRLNTVVDQRNLDNIARTLDNLAATSAQLRTVLAPENQARLQRILANVEATTSQTAPLTAELRGLVRHLATLTERGEGLLLQADATGARLQASTLPQAEQLMRELNTTSHQLARVLERLDADPQMLLLGHRNDAHAGPGEAGFVAPTHTPSTETAR
jgi:phospholipid/cholesterol/gamma-HCH transport system substrate-binding protein